MVAISTVPKTIAGLSGLIFLLLIISQFLAYFNYTNMATIAAVKMADALRTPISMRCGCLSGSSSS